MRGAEQLNLRPGLRSLEPFHGRFIVRFNHVNFILALGQ